MHTRGAIRVKHAKKDRVVGSCTRDARFFHIFSTPRRWRTRSTLVIGPLCSEDRRVTRSPLAYVLILLTLAAAPSARASDSGTPLPLFLVFLADGTTVTCYGEYARADERVVFNVPLDIASDQQPATLRTVSLPASTVDWARTERYADSVRAARYAVTRGEEDYTALTAAVAHALERINDATAPAERVRIADDARRRLSAWPSAHYGYRAADVRQLVALLDEVVSGLRVAAGEGAFAFDLVAGTLPPRFEPVREPPTLQEAIAQALGLAKLVDQPTDRVAILGGVVETIDRHRASLPADWARTSSKTARLALDHELKVERAYRDLARTSLERVRRLSGRADVRGVERLRRRVERRDAQLGGARPAEVSSLLAEIDRQLDAARRLRLARDQWALKVPVYHRYRQDIRSALEAFSRSRHLLDDIRALAGPELRALDSVEPSLVTASRSLMKTVVPGELAASHALLGSAMNLALTAIRGRALAVAANDVARAREASAAAAGALMLFDRARADRDHLTSVPK
jgi:hypothetical protein